MPGTGRDRRRRRQRQLGRCRNRRRRQSRRLCRLKPVSPEALSSGYCIWTTTATAAAMRSRLPLQVVTLQRPVCFAQIVAAYPLTIGLEDKSFASKHRADIFLERRTRPRRCSLRGSSQRFWKGTKCNSWPRSSQAPQRWLLSGNPAFIALGEVPHGCGKSEMRRIYALRASVALEFKPAANGDQ